MSDVEAVLDADTGEGYLLIRDAATFAELTGKFAELKQAGWFAVEPWEASEPVDYPDGTRGVKTWLFREDVVA